MSLTDTSMSESRSDYRCPSCGYGIVASELPARCPMCGSAEWDHGHWPRFSGLSDHLLHRMPDYGLRNDSGAMAP